MRYERGDILYLGDWNGRRYLVYVLEYDLYGPELVNTRDWIKVQALTESGYRIPGMFWVDPDDIIPEQDVI